MYGHKSPRTVRPYPYRNGSHIHRKGKEDLEEPGESHAAPNHRPHLDKGRGGSRHRLAEGVQRLSGFVPFGCQLCRPDIRFLPRDNALDGEYGRVHRSTQKLSDKRLGGCIVHKPEQNIQRIDIQFHRDNQRYTDGLPVGQQDDGERTDGNRVRHPPQAATDEQETATAVDCGQVHLHGRYMGRNQRRGTSESQQGGNRPFCHKTMETERQSRSLLE